MNNTSLSLNRRGLSPVRSILNNFFYDNFLDSILDRRFGLLDYSDINNGIDIIEEKDRYIAKIEMPGIEKESINIEIDGQMVKVSSSISNKSDKDSDKEEDKKYLVKTIERNYTNIFSLPSPVKIDDVNASLVNGVLEISLPKLLNSQAKKIVVK